MSYWLVGNTTYLEAYDYLLGEQETDETVTSEYNSMYTHSNGLVLNNIERNRAHEGYKLYCTQLCRNCIEIEVKV